MTVVLWSQHLRIERPPPQVECDLCSGAGMVPHASRCPVCAGTGRMAVTQVTQVTRGCHVNG